MADFYKKEIIDPNDKASKLAHVACTQSYENCKAVEVIPREPGKFRGGVDFNWKKNVLVGMHSGHLAQTVQNDGAGGKPQFFAYAGKEDDFCNLGWEIITMCADDIARFGGFPAVMVNDLNVKDISPGNLRFIKALFRGYGEALRKARLVNITGEIAVMRNSITAFCDFNQTDKLILTWGAACIGLVAHDRVINGNSIGPDMPIVGFHEDGYRCNGGTFFTKLLLEHFVNGVEESILTNRRALEFASKLTVPSKSYARTIARVNGWRPDGGLEKPRVGIAGIAHITGGGVWGKFREMLPDGIGAKLFNMPEPPAVLKEAQKLSWHHPDLKLSDSDAYSTFHGGCGMMIACKTGRDAIALIREARHDGVKASIVGKTTKSKHRTVFIDSRFKEGKRLSSRALKD